MQSRSSAAVRSFIVSQQVPEETPGVDVFAGLGSVAPVPLSGAGSREGRGAAPGGAAAGAACALPLPRLLLL